LTALSWAVDDTKNINHLLQSASEYIDDTLLRSCLVKISNNLTLLTGPTEPLLDWGINEEDLLSDMVKSSRHLSDYTVIDIPAGRLTVEKRAALLNVTHVVIVTEPTIKGIKNLGILYHAIKRIRPNDAEPLVLLNKIGLPQANHLSNKIIHDNIGIAPNLSVRHISEILDLAIDSGVPVSSISGSDPFNEDILECTNFLLGKKSNNTHNSSQINKFLSNVKKAIGL
jgi:pilus assembly protein CpaE